MEIDVSEVINSASKWKLLGRHKHVVGAEIREYVDMNSDGWIRRYTATIRGWTNWRIGTGCLYRGDYTFDQILDRVREIRDKIDAGDKSVFEDEAYSLPIVNNITITRAEADAFSAKIRSCD